MGERKGESADPDGGVILVALAVVGFFGAVLGGVFGFWAGAVWR